MKDTEDQVKKKIADAEHRVEKYRGYADKISVVLSNNAKVRSITVVIGSDAGGEELNAILTLFDDHVIQRDLVELIKSFLYSTKSDALRIKQELERSL